MIIDHIKINNQLQKRIKGIELLSKGEAMLINPWWIIAALAMIFCFVGWLWVKISRPKPKTKPLAKLPSGYHG